MSACPGCGRPLFQGRCLGTSARPGCSEGTSPAAAPAGAPPAREPMAAAATPAAAARGPMVAAAAAASVGDDRTAAIAALRGTIVRRAEDVEARRGFGTILKPRATVRSMLGLKEPVLRVAWDDGSESRRTLGTLSIATPEELRRREAKLAGMSVVPPAPDPGGLAAWDPSDAPSAPAWCGHCGSKLEGGGCPKGCAA